jgi:hypothetical protein
MRLPQFHLRTLIISIAFVALILTVIIQNLLLQREAAKAAVIERMLRQEQQRNFPAPMPGPPRPQGAQSGTPTVPR